MIFSVKSNYTSPALNRSDHHHQSPSSIRSLSNFIIIIITYIKNYHQLSFIANGEEALVQIATSSPCSFPGLRRLLSLFFFPLVPCSSYLFMFLVHVPCSCSLFMFLVHVPCSCSLFMFPTHVPFLFPSRSCHVHFFFLSFLHFPLCSFTCAEKLTKDKWMPSKTQSTWKSTAMIHSPGYGRWLLPALHGPLCLCTLPPECQ